MPKPSLTDVFGAGATQTATTITIDKADLPGLTPSATNTAEALIVGINLRAQTNLTAAARDTDPDRKVAIENGFNQLVTRGGVNYRQSSLTLTMQKTEPSAAIDPDDY